jgi:magnesium transporter
MKAFYKNSKGFISCTNWETNCWVNVECPSPDDKKYLVDELGVPLAFLNDIEDIDERPRIEIEDEWFLIILRVPYKTDDLSIPFTTIPLGLVFNNEVFVTVCGYKTDLISDYIQYSVRKSIEFTDNLNLVLRIMLSSSVWFSKYLKQINQDIRLAENKLEKSIKNQELHALLQIEKCLVFFTTSLKGNDILLHRIKNLKDYKHTFDPELVEDVEIELRQAQDTTSIYSDILSGMMDAYASVISNNLNVIMKQLTSISIILMIPTLIASLYGMNVPNFFENNPFGFWFVLAISLVLSTIGVLFFRRKNWF